MDYKAYLADRLNVSKELLETPPDPKMGDYALPCFKLAKEMRKAPPLIAQELAEKVRSYGEDPLIEDIQVAGGYLNFFMSRGYVAEKCVSAVLSDAECYGRSKTGAGRKVIVEYSSPNIAKPFHIGHLVTTALGNSLANIYDALGYDVVRINHLGDWGTQFGKLISAYKRWGDREAIEKDPIAELLKIYVKFHEVAEAQPELGLEDEARNYFRLLEEGDPEVTKLWQFFKDASLKEFNRMYDRLDMHFDSYAGESFYQDKMPAVVEEIRAKGILEESDGAQVVRFDEEKMPPCIILKSDGATIYATRDITAAIYRKNTYDFYKNIYVVGLPQALHFKQVFGTLKKMGYAWADDCIHVGYGHIRFPEGHMSTRHGQVILLEDVLNEAVAKTKDIILSSGTGKIDGDIDATASVIGIGAVLFALQKNNRERDIIFKWEDMLDFEGESGPYAQYTYARGRSILRKAEEQGISYNDADLKLLTGDDEYAIVKLLGDFGDVIADSASRYEPCVITRYIIDLAQTFNKFYNNTNIMRSEPEEQKARLALTEAVTTVLRSALALIGIKVVEKM